MLSSKYLCSSVRHVVIDLAFFIVMNSFLMLTDSDNIKNNCSTITDDYFSSYRVTQHFKKVLRSAAIVCLRYLKYWFIIDSY
jgi:hypothetical protein